ncbi:MAG: hypothetical protein CR988_07655 [Treponema sp.]|nr:MAG: hypothetical protein CR988_07655 [Treponema sp.]
MSVLKIIKEGLKMNESFIFYESFKEQLKDLDADTRHRFTDYIIDYGLYEIEPEVSGLEKSLWLSFKKDIDYAKSRRKKQKQNGSKGGRPLKEKPTETEENPQKPTETHENPNAKTETEENPQKPAETHENLNVDGDVDDDVDVNGDEEPPQDISQVELEKITVSQSQQEVEEAISELEALKNIGLTELAKKIYPIFVDLKINKPKNFNNFLMRDFRMGIDKLKQAGIKIDETILQACKNYATLLKQKQAGFDTWWSFNKGFNNFCKLSVIDYFLPDKFMMKTFEKSPPKNTNKKDKYDFNKTGEEENEDMPF